MDRQTDTPTTKMTEMMPAGGKRDNCLHTFIRDTVNMKSHRTNRFWMDQQLFWQEINQSEASRGIVIKAGSAAAAFGNVSSLVAAASFCGEDESEHQAGRHRPRSQSLESSPTPNLLSQVFPKNWENLAGSFTVLGSGVPGST